MFIYYNKYDKIDIDSYKLQTSNAFFIKFYIDSYKLLYKY